MGFDELIARKIAQAISANRERAEDSFWLTRYDTGYKPIDPSHKKTLVRRIPAGPHAYSETEALVRLAKQFEICTPYGERTNETNQI